MGNNIVEHQIEKCVSALMSKGEADFTAEGRILATEIRRLYDAMSPLSHDATDAMEVPRVGSLYHELDRWIQKRLKQEHELGHEG